MKTFKRFAAEQDVSFYHNFDILIIFFGLNVILHCIFRLFNVVSWILWFIFLSRFLIVIVHEKILDPYGLPYVNKVLLYFTLLYFTLLYFTLLYFTLLYFTLFYFTLLYFTLVMALFEVGF